MGFQKIVEGGVSGFLRRYRSMMSGLESRIAGMSKEQAQSYDRLVIAINVLLFAGIVVCMWMGYPQYIQFALAVALYIGYQVFHRAFANVIASK